MNRDTQTNDTGKHRTATRVKAPPQATVRAAEVNMPRAARVAQ